MKTFKFGQLISMEDICDRQKEITFLKKLCNAKGRMVVYGRRRFGKTSLVKNVVIADILAKNKRSIAIYADLFQVDSLKDMASRLKTAFESALSKRARLKTFISGIQNYLKHFRVEMSADPLSGMPYIHLTGQYSNDDRSLEDIFSTMNDISKEYDVLLALDEFQDVRGVTGLEAKLRSQIQGLQNIPVILLGSKRHILRDIFQNEANPFYGFGTDIEIKEIGREHWLPYMQERFKVCDLKISDEGVEEICVLMRDVPNSIQELCQWISLSGRTGHLTKELIHECVVELLDNKSSRYIEKEGALSIKEKKVLFAIAQSEPVLSLSTTSFLGLAGVSATAIKATVSRFTDQGVTDHTNDGYAITDPLYRLFLIRQR